MPIKQSDLTGEAMFGWWFAVVFAPHEWTKANPFKLVRLAGWIVTILWHILMIPVTAAIMIVLLLIDGWRNV